MVGGKLIYLLLFKNVLAYVIACVYCVIVSKHTHTGRAALADICEWMGEERFTRVDDLYRQMAPVGLELFRLQMSFAGVAGYPVEAWHRSLWPGSVATAPEPNLN